MPSHGIPYSAASHGIADSERFVVRVESDVFAIVRKRHTVQGEVLVRARWSKERCRVSLTSVEREKEAYTPTRAKFVVSQR